MRNETLLEKIAIATLFILFLALVLFSSLPI
jgi:hypothetical protein